MLSGAAVDCERILESWWGQPVNTCTAFAFVLAGLWVFFRDGSVSTSALITGVGAGSIAFHGPMPIWGEFLHDLTIGWVLIWVILTETKRTRFWPVAFSGVGLMMLAPVVADPAQGVLSIGAIVFVLIGRHPQRFSIVGLLALGAAIGTLSRTGWPWCDPDSIWQGHGFWHLAAAAALALWALPPRQLSARGFAGSVSGPGPARSG